MSERAPPALHTSRQQGGLCGGRDQGGCVGWADSGVRRFCCAVALLYHHHDSTAAVIVRNRAPGGTPGEVAGRWNPLRSGVQPLVRSGSSVVPCSEYGCLSSGCSPLCCLHTLTKRLERARRSGAKQVQLRLSAGTR